MTSGKKIIQGDFEFIPYKCICRCEQYIKLNKKYISAYEREGYPKFICGHHVRINHPMKLTEIEKEIHKIQIKRSKIKKILESQKIPFIPTICYCMKPDCYEICYNGHNFVQGHHSRVKNPKGMLGKTQSEEFKKNKSEEMKGNKYKLGKKESIETCKKKSISSSGSLNSNYVDGSSYLPYCSKFNNKLKQQVRLRDNYICQLCDKTQEQEKLKINQSLNVHHIHYDKKNCYPDLISLCGSCNAKVNFNRNYYESLFMNKLNERELLFWTRNMIK